MLVRMSPIQSGSRTLPEFASGLRTDDQNRGVRAEAKKAGAGGDQEPIKVAALGPVIL